MMSRRQKYIFLKLSSSVWPDGQIICSIFGRLQQHWNFAQWYKKLAKYASNFAQYEKNLTENGQRFLKMAKVAKFWHIWSHWHLVVNNRKEMIVVAESSWLTFSIKRFSTYFDFDSFTNIFCQGSGCDSVGRAVASDSRGLQFETSHWWSFKECLFAVNCTEKTNIKKKRPGMAY